MIRPRVGVHRVSPSNISDASTSAVVSVVLHHDPSLGPGHSGSCGKVQQTTTTQKQIIQIPTPRSKIIPTRDPSSVSLYLFTLVCCHGGSDDNNHGYVPHSAPQGRPARTLAPSVLHRVLLHTAIHGHRGQCVSNIHRIYNTVWTPPEKTN